MEFYKIPIKRLLPFIFILCGISIFVLLKITRPKSVTQPPEERSWHVKTMTAKLQQLAPTLTLYGQIETPELVKAAAPKNSRVTQVFIREGDPISQGQILLTLDPRDFKPRLIQAQAKADELRALIKSEQLRYTIDQQAIRHERAILKLEKSAVKRAEMLKNKKLGSTAALEEAQEALKRQQLSFSNRKLAVDDHSARLQQLQARLHYSEAEVDLAELDLERSQVIAPFNGFVEQLSVAAGDQVKENQILISFYPSNKLELRAKIPAAYQNEIQQALLSGQMLSAHAEYAGKPISLKLDRFSGKADMRGIDALFSIQPGNISIRLGAVLTVVLQRPSYNNVVALPYSAIYDNNRIYRIINQRLEAISIDILGDYKTPTQDRLLVFSPILQEGDRILTTQLPGAVSGLKVNIN